MCVFGRERECVCVCVKESLYVCERETGCLCVRVCVCTGVYVTERQWV